MSKSPSSSRRLTSHLALSLLPLQVMLAVVSYLSEIISTLFASNAVGAASMAAIGLYSPVTKAISAFCILLSAGSALLSSQYIGKNEIDHLQNVFTVNIVLTCILSVVVAALHVLAVLVGWAGTASQDAVVNALFAQYLLGKAIGILPLIMGVQLTSFLSMENQLKLTTFAGLVYIVANLVFHTLFVVVLRMEALGLALAASCSSWVFLIVLIQHFIRGKSLMRLEIKKIQWREGRAILKLGFSSALINGYYAVRSGVINYIILTLGGTTALSAYATAYTFMNIFWSLPDAMEAVSRMLIGVSIGEEDKQALTDIMRVMYRQFVPMALAMTVVACALAEPLTNLYYHDAGEAIYQMTMWGIRIYAWCYPLSVITMHFNVYANAMGKRVLVHGITLLDGFVCVPLFMVVLMPFMGLNGAFLAYPLRGVAVCLFILAYAWVRNGRFPRNLEELMVIPRDFGVEPDARMDLSVQSIEETVTVSRRVRAFCACRGIDSRRTFFAGLCLEEMAGNVVSHGFAADKKRHSVDIRVTHKDDDLILRIKDDCVPFDPKERMEMIDPEDRAHNIGIRMVYGLASSICYQHILGLNVLTVRI